MVYVEVVGAGGPQKIGRQENFKASQDEVRRTTLGVSVVKGVEF